MKKLKLGFLAIGSLLTFASVIVMSCNKDRVSIADVNSINSDNIRDRANFPSKEETLKMARETPMKIEHVTVKQYNAIMREHGLPEYVPKDGVNYYKRGGCPSPDDCADMNMLCWLGDYNNDSSLSTLDLILLTDHCNQNCIQFYPSEWGIYKAAMASDVIYGIDADKWDYVDIDYLREAILCNGCICDSNDPCTF